MEEQSGQPMGFKEKLAHFWYYYKWHALAVLIVLVAVIVCTVQMCAKESYDFYLLYAGGGELPMSSQDGSPSPYAKVRSSAKRYASDLDGDGDVNVALRSLFVLSTDEIRQVEEELRKLKEEKSESYEVNYALIADNSEELRDLLRYSEYYVCLLSESVYQGYANVGGVDVFVPLAPFASAEGLVYLDDTAVKLSSTKLGTLPGFDTLPPDTVICFRAKAAISQSLGKKKNEEIYAAAEDAIRAILAEANEKRQ